ncbi:hypothetical protein N7499_012048 [Penicillium canescens]|nr:hypothetical protein N7499_012048 [Penicillium canescens]KAJ6181788.1 hypothetical protein N7485_000430 [Penicillium canescens]
MKRSIYTDHKRRVTSERNPRNVDRLREVFSKEGYRRLDVPNHITTVVSSDSLDTTLQKSRTSAA